jgi:hypothetical protein
VQSDGQTSQAKQKRFDTLMKAGKDALDKGDRRAAHDLWREAATLDPYNEKIWLALYRVLNTDEDRIVCLQNIIAINPMNVQARRRLHTFEEERQAVKVAPPPRPKAKTTTKTAPKTSVTGEYGRSQLQRVKRQRQKLLRRALLIGLLAGATGVLGGIIISILLYGR